MHHALIFEPLIGPAEVCCPLHLFQTCCLLDSVFISTDKQTSVQSHSHVYYKNHNLNGLTKFLPKTKKN